MARKLHLTPLKKRRKRLLLLRNKSIGKELNSNSTNQPHLNLQVRCRSKERLINRKTKNTGECGSGMAILTHRRRNNF